MMSRHQDGLESAASQHTEKKRRTSGGMAAQESGSHVGPGYDIRGGDLRTDEEQAVSVGQASIGDRYWIGVAA